MRSPRPFIIARLPRHLRAWPSLISLPLRSNSTSSCWSQATRLATPAALIRSKWERVVGKHRTIEHTCNQGVAHLETKLDAPVGMAVICSLYSVWFHQSVKRRVTRLPEPAAQSTPVGGRAVLLRCDGCVPSSCRSVNQWVANPMARREAVSSRSHEERLEMWQRC